MLKLERPFDDIGNGTFWGVIRFRWGPECGGPLMGLIAFTEAEKAFELPLSDMWGHSEKTFKLPSLCYLVIADKTIKTNC